MFSVIRNTNLGKIIIKGSHVGISHIELMIPTESFTQTTDEIFNRWADKIVEKINNPKIDISVPLLYQGTKFQNDVWEAIKRIKLGSTKTYQDIANEIGNPKAVRAVGTAVGSNPYPVLVPCHRVIGKNGNWKKFGWGSENKEKLLKMEGVSL